MKNAGKVVCFVLLCATSLLYAEDTEVVRPGDTIDGIVLRYCKPRIMAANRGLRPDIMHPGDALEIPFVPDADFRTVSRERDDFKSNNVWLERELAAVMREMEMVGGLAKEAQKENVALEEERGRLRSTRNALTLALVGLMVILIALLTILMAAYNQLGNMKKSLAEVTKERDKLKKEREDIGQMCRGLAMKAFGGKLKDKPFDVAWLELEDAIRTKYATPPQEASAPTTNVRRLPSSRKS